MPDILSAAAEPTRRRILQLLASGPRTVTDLAANFTVTRSAISQHLGVLTEVGLVVAARRADNASTGSCPQEWLSCGWSLRDSGPPSLISWLRMQPHALPIDDPADPQRRTRMFAEKTVLLPVSTDEAFALITEPDRLRRWKTVSARVDLRAGGQYRWGRSPGGAACAP